MPSQPGKVPTFTVVTPSFNQLGWLRLCAASVADQQGVVVEHLVQDAGTGKDLETWAASQAKLRLFVEQDQGMYDAVNRGLRRGSGDILSYLNCDEQYLPGALAQVATFFQLRPDVDVLFGDTITLRRDGRPVGYRRVVVPRMAHTRLSHLDTFTCAMFFRRSLVERGHLFDTNWKGIGDMVWVHGLLKANVRMAVLPEPLAAYAYTGENLSDSPLMQQEFDRWRQTPNGQPSWLRVPVIIHHRLRKLLAGAYVSRRLDLELYSPESPGARKRWTAVRLSNFWCRTISQETKMEHSVSQAPQYMTSNRNRTTPKVVR